MARVHTDIHFLPMDVYTAFMDFVVNHPHVSYKDVRPCDNISISSKHKDFIKIEIKTIY